MKRLLYEINAFEELFGSGLVENGFLHISEEQEVYLEDEIGRTTCIIVEIFEKLNNQTVCARQVYGRRS